MIRRYLIGLIMLLLVTSCTGANEKSAIETALLWSRMAPLPAEITELQVETTGSSFSREFTISFRANKEVIQKWIDASDGPQDAQVAFDDELTIYQIVPGEGAQFAELTVDWTTLIVKLNTYWS